MSDGEHVVRQTRLTPGYVEVILTSLIIVIGAVYCYDRYFAQKIKIVDMSGYLRQQKELIATGELTKANFRANLSKIDALISRDAKTHENQIYILKEVVLKNGDELILK